MRNLLYVTDSSGKSWRWSVLLPSGSFLIGSNFVFGSKAEAERDVKQFLGREELT